MKIVLIVLLACSCGDVINTTGPDASSAASDADAQLDAIPDSPPISGSTFLRGYDGVDFTDATHPATISSFRLDTHEVTVARFRAFVTAGRPAPAADAAAHAAIAGSGWNAAWSSSLATSDLKCSSQYQTWTDEPGANEQKPINCVTWYEAFAFCAWDGGYLPTEAEWNYAQAGGSDQRVYPWSVPASSTSIDCTYANYDGLCGQVSIKDVGSKSTKGDSRWEHADLVGNVAEWTLDLFETPTSYVTPCNDCANLTIGTSRIYRGGHFGSASSSTLRVVGRPARPPDDRNPGVGVRCARPM